MKNRPDKAKPFTDHDDKYNINDKYDTLNTNATTELTGVVSHGPGTEEDLEVYNDVFTFNTKDIVIDKEDYNKKDDKHKKYDYKPKW